MNTREVTSQYRLNQWTEIVRQCRSSGQTIAVWCEENNIKRTSYYYWLKKIRQAACETLPSLNENNTIVPVNISDLAVKIDPSDQESTSDIVIHIGAVKLEIRNTASAILIENVFKVLKNVR
ncbi:IS66 family insertion sequence element accessory protein TnpA [Defluviitalea saccharophila]|uniref:IS66 family insertion sequence element accessory protein TnpB n=1 Tax=Defluviitalea saccharophila TaxID=879970 RepID=A0ABZ2Y2Y7_9FIRM